MPKENKKSLKSYLSEEDIHTVSELLIDLVSSVPMIYDKTLESYKDTAKRKKKFREFVTAIFESTGIMILSGKHSIWLILSLHVH